MTLNKALADMCVYGEVSGPVCEALIDVAEIELNVYFPEQYREFLRQYGSILLDGVEIYGLPDPVKNDPPVWQDVVWVTKKLQEWRQAGTENRALIPISEDGTGIYFFIDTEYSPDTKILAIGSGVFEVVSTDLFDFIVNLSAGNIRV